MKKIKKKSRKTNRKNEAFSASSFSSHWFLEACRVALRMLERNWRDTWQPWFPWPSHCFSLKKATNFPIYFDTSWHRVCFIRKWWKLMDFFWNWEVYQFLKWQLYVFSREVYLGWMKKIVMLKHILELLLMCKMITIFVFSSSTRCQRIYRVIFPWAKCSLWCFEIQTGLGKRE